MVDPLLVDRVDMADQEDLSAVSLAVDLMVDHLVSLLVDTVDPAMVALLVCPPVVTVDPMAVAPTTEALPADMADTLVVVDRMAVAPKP